MSQKDFEAAIKRLKKANQDIHWALSVLDNPSSHLKDYELTPEETEALFQQFHALLAETHTAQAYVLLKRVNIEVENKEVQIVGPVPPWLSSTTTIRSVEPTLPIVGPVEPWKTEAVETIVGPVEPSETTEAVGPVEPYNSSHRQDAPAENQPHSENASHTSHEE